MIEFAYLCNQDPTKKKVCSGLSGHFCGECIHTISPEYAKNKETVEFVNELRKRFDIISTGTVRFIERGD